MKENSMKTVTKNSLLKAVMAVVLACAALLPARINAADEPKPMKPMKGGEHLMMLNGIDTKQEVDALKTDDSIAMVCTKCKTVWVSRVKQGVKGAQLLMQGGQTKECLSLVMSPLAGPTTVMVELHPLHACVPINSLVWPPSIRS